MQISAETLSAHKEWANTSGEAGVRAYLKGANLEGADLEGANTPNSLVFTPDPFLASKIIEAIESEGCALKMDSWHTCSTTHCLAGWAVHLHPDGARLEHASSTYLAGRLLLGLDHHQAQIFFGNEDEAMFWPQNAAKEGVEP